MCGANIPVGLPCIVIDLALVLAAPFKTTWIILPWGVVISICLPSSNPATNPASLSFWLTPEKLKVWSFVKPVIVYFVSDS